MDRRVIFLFIAILIFTLQNISAFCEDGQIDINSASLDELDELYGVGLAKAQAIIDARPFESVNDLIEVSGIAEFTLENIKNQGLACVEEESYPDEEEVNTPEEVSSEEIPPEEEIPEENVIIEENPSDKKSDEDKEKNVIEDMPENYQNPSGDVIFPNEIIELNSKDIKTKNGKEKLSKDNYAFYGLIAFCLLLLFLFVTRRKNRYKNEFR